MEFLLPYLDLEPTNQRQRPEAPRQEARSLAQVPLWEPEVSPPVIQKKKPKPPANRFGDVSEYLSFQKKYEEEDLKVEEEEPYEDVEEAFDAEYEDDDFEEEDEQDEQDEPFALDSTPGQSTFNFAPLLRHCLGLLCAGVSIYAILALLGSGIDLAKLSIHKQSGLLSSPDKPAAGSAVLEQTTAKPGGAARAVAQWGAEGGMAPPPEETPTKPPQIPDLINTSGIDPARFEGVPQPDGLKVGLKQPGYMETPPEDGSQKINVGVDKISPDGPYTRVWYINAKIRFDQLNDLIAKTKPGHLQSDLLANRNLLAEAYNRQMNETLARVYKVKPSL